MATLSVQGIGNLWNGPEYGRSRAATNSHQQKAYGDVDVRQLNKFSDHHFKHWSKQHESVFKANVTINQALVFII